MSSVEPLADADHLSERERECLELCQQATEVCEWCADECARIDGMTDCVRLCRDVSDIASLHVKFLARGSDHREALAGVCATVCRDCAEECENHEHDHCRTCAEVLRECAEACESMVK
ncbi:four-helix bundle copper-binding protein [Haloarcula salina]|uniref:four-helix bundle copper-binding protein n=1 Tax=Haloarcula salina TaxID=1429914 RepID=UPI003C6FDEBC